MKGLSVCVRTGFVSLVPQGRLKVVQDCVASYSNRGTRELFASHGSNVLYQGTTLVGPHRTYKDMGFSP